jgi:hypothetical protein
MEVHAHTHTARKKWTHYFWEFLMLFLAVTLGFFVENQREHYIEHQREKKYAEQLLSDLQGDSVSFNVLVDMLDTVIADHEEFTTLMTNVNKPSNKEVLNGLIPIYNGISMYPGKATYLEMKSSGSLRYIRSAELSAGIKKYYEENLEYIKVVEKICDDIFTNHVRPYMIKHFKSTDIDYKAGAVKSADPVFLNRNPETETELLNIMEEYRRILRSYQKNAVIPSAKRVNELIKLLKQEYHLK